MHSSRSRDHALLVQWFPTVVTLTSEMGSLNLHFLKISHKSQKYSVKKKKKKKSKVQPVFEASNFGGKLKLQTPTLFVLFTTCHSSFLKCVYTRLLTNEKNFSFSLKSEVKNIMKSSVHGASTHRWLRATALDCSTVQLGCILEFNFYQLWPLLK